MDDNYQMMSLAKIKTPADPSRVSIDADKVRQLAETIREQGQLQPILVRPSDGMFEIVFGHRRFLACKILGESKIKAFVREMSDDEMFLARALENIQREDLKPTEQARTYQVLKVKGHMSIEDISRKIGKNRDTIKQYLHLLDLPVEFQEAVDVGSIGIRVACKLLEVDDEEIRRYYLQNAAEHGVTLKVAKVWVADYEKSKAGKFYDGTIPEGGVDGGYTPQPIYLTCQLRGCPCEVSDAVHLTVCRKCYNEIASLIYKGGD